VALAQGAGCKRPEQEGLVQDRDRSFSNTRTGTEVTSFRQTRPEHSTSNLAALSSSTSCGNYSPWRKKSSIFNKERVLGIRRLTGTQVFCSFNLMTQLSRNGSSSPFIKSDALAVELGGPDHPKP